jgi:hypothetical protein
MSLSLFVVLGSLGLGLGLGRCVEGRAIGLWVLRKGVTSLWRGRGYDFG